jgi:hypothetical protein
VSRDDREPRIYWWWVPAATLAVVRNWIEFGPGVAIATTAAGLGIGLYLRRRGRRKREEARRSGNDPTR